MGSAAAYCDVQTAGSHLDPDVSLQKYTYEKLLEYWSMVYTLGLLAGVAGTEDEQTAARDAVFAALEGALEETSSFLSAMATAVDDYTPPGVGAAVLHGGKQGISAIQGVGKFFGQDFGFDDDIENLDRRIRDSVAVDVNQTSQVMRGGKATLEAVSRNTGWFDYAADTTQENRMIAATQSTVDRRQAQINAAFEKVWNAIKETAFERYNQFISDWDKGGLGYAIGTLGIDAAFLAIEVAIAAAAAAVTGGAGAVALKVAVSIGKKIGNAARAVVVSLKRAGGHHGKTGQIPLSEKNIVEHAEKHDGFGDDHAGVPNSNHNNAKDPGAPKVVDVGPGQKRTTRGEGDKINENNITYDPATGRPINATGTLRQDFGGTKRGDNATDIGRLGKPKDEGGHLVGHRFMGDTPDEGIVPQAGNLNKGAWKTMENEWADWIAQGYEVDYDISVFPPGAVRPDKFEVAYKVRDPVTGKIIHKDSPDFKNEAGQSFDRVYFRGKD